MSGGEHNSTEAFEKLLVEGIGIRINDSEDPIYGKKKFSTFIKSQKVKFKMSKKQVLYLDRLEERVNKFIIEDH